MRRAFGALAALLVLLAVTPARAQPMPSWGGSGGGGGCNGAPAAACTAGYTTQTFSQNFTNATVNTAATCVAGWKWSYSNFFGESPANSTVTVNGDGTVTLEAATSANINNQLSSICVTGASSPYWHGTAFGGGAYIDIVANFNAAAVDDTFGWPSAWAMSMEHMVGSSGGPQLDQWTGQAAGYVHFSEPDIMEGQFVGAGNPYGATLHDWWGTFGVTCGAGVFCNSQNVTQHTVANYSLYHHYQMLWIQATASVKGSVTWYVDGVPIGPAVTWTQYVAGSDVPPPTSYPWLYGVIDATHLAVMLGAGTNTPMNVQSVTVWQPNAANNLTQ